MPLCCASVSKAFQSYRFSTFNQWFIGQNLIQKLKKPETGNSNSNEKIIAEAGSGRCRIILVEPEP
jgi:hypothetical protein